jgi:GntR family hexuronate regulon transcriptional repressor
VWRIAEENLQDQGAEEADRAFHLLIARATRNRAIVNVVGELWRPISSASALLSSKVRSASSKAVVEERRAIARVLRARDPSKARASMRAHLRAVMDQL